MWKLGKSRVENMYNYDSIKAVIETDEMQFFKCAEDFRKNVG